MPSLPRGHFLIHFRACLLFRNRLHGRPFYFAGWKLRGLCRRLPNFPMMSEGICDPPSKAAAGSSAIITIGAELPPRVSRLKLKCSGDSSATQNSAVSTDSRATTAPVSLSRRNNSAAAGGTECRLLNLSALKGEDSQATLRGCD